MTAELTEQKENADLLQPNKTSLQEPQFLERRDYCDNNFSSLEHNAQHVFIFSKHTAPLNAQQSPNAAEKALR